MALKIYNTRTRQKEEFVPAHPGKVNLYVCGVTVYDHCHVGHGRAYVVFDMIVRYLKYLNFLVHYVRNVTDVDDKIIDKAKNTPGSEDLKEKVKKITHYFYSEFIDAMDKLNVEKPNIEPTATEHIQDMIKLIHDLFKAGVAYRVGGDVYFDISKWSGYGALSGRNLEELKVGARVEVDPRKKNPLDFALWKESKPDEPYWKSDWSNGRPGWHIECSAMSMKYLPDLPIDIHGGGQDLIFPHHENELAQSEAAQGKPFVKYWLHNGFITFDKQKMSKSLGNFFLLKEVFEKFSPQLVRFYYLSQHYRSPMEFSDAVLKETKESFEKIETCISLTDRHLRQYGPGVPEIDLKRKPQELHDFEEEMNDDFNTPRILSLVHKLITEINKARESRKITSLDTQKYASLKKILDILGIQIESKYVPLSGKIIERLLPADIQKLLMKESCTFEELEKLNQERNILRRNKNYKLADEIRKKIHESGYQIEDTPEGPRLRKQ